MSIDINNRHKLNHPYYKIMNLKNSELQSELITWPREELIEWLCWNDSNGVYRDVDSLREFDNILEKEEAIKIIRRQITEG